MDNCVNKFLVTYNHGNVEKHSDSSDFDETQTIPFVAPKNGTHNLIHRNSKKHTKVKVKASTISCKTLPTKTYGHLNVEIVDENVPVRDHNSSTNQRQKKAASKKEKTKLNSTGDGVSNQQQIYNSNALPHKTTPCFSNIFKRSYNNTQQIASIKEIPEGTLNSGKTFCTDCERRRIKKLNRHRRSYVVQPVYAVDNLREGPVPFGDANDQAPLSQHNHKVARKQDSYTSYELTSSESEIERTDQQKHVGRRRNFIDRFQKEMRKEYLKYEKELLRNRIQQYPSKRDYHFPYQVLSTPYCQAQNPGSTLDQDHSNIPSTSSGFWEYLFEKIRGKHMLEKSDTSKPCYCSPPATMIQQQTSPCTPQDCAHFDVKPEEPSAKPKQLIPECKSCMQQTDQLTESLLKMQPTKTTPTQSVKCKCYSNRKRRQQLDTSKHPLKSMTQNDDENRPCQEPHDDITRTVEEKYNGEILCIHNPPCILINGCLNLPIAKETTPVQGNFWPVTQDKKSSFYQMCRKIKRSKQSYEEQGCQYHPPSIEVQQALQIKPEKIVQSICNHDPPCEVVYGCYKAKYDPKLDNSCVHVPMCQRLPECLIEDRQERQKLCEHKPKCNEVPLCSRKFVILTARGTVGTQVRPKSKLVCRHEPPCIMIPKCLARIISDSYIPCDAIPDCVHQPCCDLIPACCRKAAKEMVSASSQYPNAPCRIV